MKIPVFCFGLTVLLTAIFSNFDMAAENRDFGGFSRYAKANKEIPVKKKGEKRVVFLGNSITDQWLKYSPEFFADNNYINRGISGQTSYQFLLRFREDVINLNPDLVVINVGTNDCAENTCAFNADITIGNLISMVELAKANKIKVVLTSVLPAAGFRWNKNITDASERIELLNRRIKSYAKENRIPYVDYYSSMVSGSERALNPEFTNDGVHPLKSGYTVMESLINPVIKRYLK